MRLIADGFPGVMLPESRAEIYAISQVAGATRALDEIRSRCGRVDEATQKAAREKRALRRIPRARVRKQLATTSARQVLPGVVTRLCETGSSAPRSQIFAASPQRLA